MADIVGHVALSHPEVSFKFIREGKLQYVTPGDGQLRSAAYAVLGREFSRDLVEVDNREGVYRVWGLITQPRSCRASRSMQYFYINGRYVRNRVDFTPEISESVYRRMEAERKRVASEERSKGAAEAEKIKADADRQRTVVLAEAYRDAQNIKGSGDAKANELYAKAFSKDPEFAKFYRSLDAYRQPFNKPQDMMVVDPSSEFFDYLKNSRGEAQANKQP